MTEILLGFLKIGATGYGGPAILGIMQAEFQERRQWTSKSRFLEGLARVNVLPGATAPGFLLMRVLTVLYNAVVLVRMAPHTAPDAPAVVALIVTAAALVVWRFTALQTMAGGALFGILRDRAWAR